MSRDAEQAWRRNRARSTRSTRSPRSRAVRRRRIVLAAAVVVVVAVAVVVTSSGSQGTAAPPLGGPGPATTLDPSTPSGVTSGVAPFRPAPAAVSLASRLPLSSQVAQLFLVGLGGTSPSSPDIAAFANTDWGGAVLDRGNFVSDSQIAGLTSDVAALARSAGHVAPLIAAPQDGGPTTAFPDLPPQAESMVAAAGVPAGAHAQATLAGRQLRAIGVNMTFAPLADVDVLGGALSGSLYSSDPHTVARFASAAVSGYADSGLIAAAGHFPGAGAASANPDEMTATVGGSLQTLEQRDLIPFAAITSSVPVIMMSNAAYAAFDGVTPAALLPHAVQLLRDRYGFQGVVMTDDLDAAILATGGTAGQAAISALGAGDDLLYITGTSAEQLSAYQAVLSAVQSGKISRAELRDALLRVLTLKARYGLLG